MTGLGFKDMRPGVQHGLLKLLEGTIATVPPLNGAIIDHNVLTLWSI